MPQSVSNYDYQVGFADGTNPKDYNGRFITGRTCFLAAGEPIYEDNADDLSKLKVIGVTQNIGLQFQKQLQRIFELGSSENLIVPGRAVPSLSISKVWYSGPNIQKALYPNVTEEELDALKGQRPGYNNTYMNLASHMFDHPCGLLMVMTSQGNSLTTYDNELVAAYFAENCYIQASGLQMAANSVVLAERSALQVERVLPIDPGSFE